MVAPSPSRPATASASPGPTPGPAADPAPSRRAAAVLVAVLGALTAVAPLATDMYVPGFPAMGDALGASSSAVQLTMTAFLAGLVVGQLLIGPLSDGLGRRRLLISGAAGFVLLSLACALAPNVTLLTGARFLQGVAGAAGMVLARAVLTDRFHGADLPRRFAVLSQVMGVAPIVAPVLGGVVLTVSTWRAVFAVLTLLGGLLLLAVVRAVPESLPPERRHSGGVASTFRAMGALLGRRAFMGYVLVVALVAAALFTYISGSSFVFENLHGVSSTTYSLIFATNAVGTLVTGTVFSRLAGRGVRLNTLLVAGVGVSLLGALGQVVLVLSLGETLAGTWITLFVTVSGIGLVFPAGMSIGQTVGRTAPGAASALVGGLQFLFGALASPLVGLFGEDSSLPMALIMLTAVAGAALALVGLARPWQGHGEPGAAKAGA
ncbi:multidrug effflux MFS transporter [Streptomyces resistomycificus]|uniref:Multidrug transporter n=1 Tax=Streptomyces resistomycificus TaxID=67356 RepID=A0A0L8LKD7_9ACTN|nr:multidrug effflux MFS transporter [Streptomyces resistomycificus]KOG38564.1 multidrug transporter [Streptomyces resistomycificus]KUO00598.1 multidrug transporter [Streptomyces resistomycificus]